MERESVIFYRSFWDAAKTLKQKDRGIYFEAILTYLYEGAELTELPDTVKGLFIMAKPVMDVQRSRSNAGKKSKTKAKQT